MKFKALSVAYFFTLGLASQMAGAHHDASVFDRHDTTTVTGTVKLFRWTNPHAWLYLDVPNNGSHDEWVLEGPSVSALVRAGWTRESIKAGDKVKALVAPRRDGKAGGEFLNVTLTDTGQVLRWGVI